MNLVNDCMPVVSSILCLTCGVDTGKIRLVNGQRFGETGYCYGDIWIKDINLRDKIENDCHCKERLEKQCLVALLNRFGSATIEITAGSDTGYVNIAWGVEP